MATYTGRYTYNQTYILVEEDTANQEAFSIAKITVVRNINETTRQVWTMSGRFHQETNKVVYTNAVKTELTLDGNSNPVSAQVLYTNGKGEFNFTMANLTWNDNMGTGTDKTTYIFVSNKILDVDREAANTNVPSAPEAPENVEPAAEPKVSDVGEPAIAPETVIDSKANF